MSEPVLRVENLTIDIPMAQGTLHAVRGIDFELKRGETLCIVGESGSGKSLTSLAIMGLLSKKMRCNAARLDFSGIDLRKQSPRAMRALRGDRMAMIFQEPMTSLNPVYTVGEQIAEIVRRHRPVGRTEARARALEMLERVKVPAAKRRLDDYPHQMSGGMRQRVMIAMALANDPRLLIADEPTTALDVTIQAQILDLMRELQQETGTALILITHDLGVVAEIADKVAVMYAGRIVETGPVAAIFDDPQHPYTLGLISSIPSLGERAGRLAAIPGMVPTVERMPAGCRFAPRCPFSDAACRTEAPPLAEISAGHAVACRYAPLERHFGDAA